MVEIAPFRGLRYNRERVPNLAEVVIPPYDVISPGEQDLFYRIHPHNMIRLELGKKTPQDSATDNPHTRAGRYLREWLREGILVREPEPAIYYYELDFALGGNQYRTRYGFISIMRLADFSTGMVKPHEKTFQAVKNERLCLMLSCHANLSPVFALYSDPSQSVDRCFQRGKKGEPTLSFTDASGMRHRIWAITDSRVLNDAGELMREKAIFIADGHHRYETALNYRDIRREQLRDVDSDAPHEYIMIYLANLHQPGMIILPTHRMLRNLEKWDPESFLRSAGEFFEVWKYPSDESAANEWRRTLESARQTKENIIGLFWHSADALCLLKARREPVSNYLRERGIAEVLHGLDVVVLDQVILRHLMGLDEAFLADENNIHFKHELSEGLDKVRSRDYEIGFFINPTRIEQVREAASSGLIMPHKSTYFYPKVGSGLVIHTLTP